ncbi:MAG: hypothetical protein EZS28_037852, partial [Streblomastix strix]
MNSAYLEPSELGLFVNFDPPKSTSQTPITITIEQPELGDEIG